MGDPLAAFKAGKLSLVADVTNDLGQMLAVAPESSKTHLPVLRSRRCGRMSRGSFVVVAGQEIRH